MNENTIIITGSNRGIGYEVATELAKTNCNIILACRNDSEAKKAKERIIQISNNRNVYTLNLDLSSFSSIRKFCEGFSRKFPKLDVLINNAGVFTMNKEVTEDGLELTMGINYFATFLLTNLLIPYLEKSEDGRIINVVSDAFKKGKIDIDAIEKSQTTGMKAYSASKFALVQFTAYLAKKLEDKNLKVNAVHPGHVYSGIWNFKKWYSPIFRLFSRVFMSNVEEGAKPILHLVLSDEIKKKTGKYFKKEKEEEIEKMDYEDLTRLWNRTKKIVGLI